MITESLSKKVYLYILATLIILQCPSVLVNSTSIISPVINILLFVFTVIISLDSLIKIIKNGRLKDNVIIFLLCTVLFSIIFLTYQYVYLYKFNPLHILPFFVSIPAFTLFFYCHSYDDDEYKLFFLKIVNVVTILAAFSLIFLVFYYFKVPTNVSIQTRWGGTSQLNGYYFLDFIAQYGNNVFGLVNVRNTGIFAEGSIFGFVLLSTLLIQLFILKVNNKHDMLKILIILVTILTTVSTTAIILAILAIILYFLNKKKGIMGFISLPFTFVGFYIINIVFNSKKSTNIKSSYSIRMNDINSCIASWKNHVIGGVGIDNNDYISTYFYFFRRTQDIGLSTGLFSLLAYGGILLVSYMLISSVLVIFKDKNMRIVSVLLTIFLIYAVVEFTYLYAIFISYFWAFILINKNKERFH